MTKRSYPTVRAIQRKRRILEVLDNETATPVPEDSEPTPTEPVEIDEEDTEET